MYVCINEKTDYTTFTVTYTHTVYISQIMKVLHTAPIKVSQFSAHLIDEAQRGQYFFTAEYFRNRTCM